jgi:hypothetical protein
VNPYLEMQLPNPSKRIMHFPLDLLNPTLSVYWTRLFASEIHAKRNDT